MQRSTSAGAGDPRNATFDRLDDRSLLGGYAGHGAVNPNARDIAAFETILSGDIGTPDDASDNCYHIIDGSNTGSNSLVEGFTIVAGNGNGNTSTTNRGAGLYINKGTLTVRHCRFFKNTSSFNGGAVYLTNAFTTFIDCEFIRNSSGSGGGMINFSDANTTLINCRFNGNTAVTGGGLYNQATSDVLVIGCLFAGNMSTNRGGGISNNFADATIINTSVVRNLAVHIRPTCRRIPAQ